MNQSKVVSLLIAIAMLSQMAFSNLQPSNFQVEMDLIEGHPAPITLPEENNSDAPQYVPDVVLLGVRHGITITTGSLNQSVKTNSTSLRMALDSIGSLSAKPLFSDEEALRSTEQDPHESDPSTIYRLQLKPGTDVEHAVDALTTLPEVTFAEPDYLAYSADIFEPTPSQLSSALTVTQLTIDDPLYSQQWGLAKIDIENAWDDTYGSPTVTIAVIDSGIDLTHVDLQNNLWVNPGETAGNSVDDDSNGYIDDVDGWNFVFSSNDVWDDNGHGTLVAGVAAGIGGNGQGIVGVCPECRIMPVKVMQASGVANYSDIAAGVLYAAQKGAKVINLSLGGYANSNTLKNAIDTAVNTYGVVVVAGAGNDNLNTPFYPAAYDNVLAVAGTAEDDAKLDFSNYAAWVDVSAPAVNVRTTALGGDWANGSGTSIASPFAAGLAGLLRVLHPDWNQATIRSQIVHTTDNIDSMNPTYFGMLGSGRLNAGVAMQPPHPILSMAGYAIDGQTNGRPVLGTSASLVLTLENDWWDALGVTGTLSTTDPLVTITSSTASFGDIPAAASRTNATAFAFIVDNSAGYNHPIAFTLDVTDTTDYSDSFNFTINTETGVENKSGTLITQTWTNDKTYLITNNISVPTGNTLTIQPGTVIKFNGNFMLSVRGTLIADGTADLPIQFKSNTAGTWDKIFFDDLNIDAVADVDGNYLSGSILRFVNIEGNTGGITCTTATPYLSHVNLQGSIACSLGATPIWLLDSTFMGSASFTGTGTAYRNTISGSLSISGAGIAEDNIVNGGGLSLGSGIAKRNTITGGGLTVGGNAGSIENNSVSGGNISAGGSFSVLNNTIAGGLVAGNSTTVSHNTVSNGITVGSSSTATWNNVENGSGTGLVAGTNVTAQWNRLIGNATGMMASTGLIEHNLIANNTGVGLQVGAATVRYNTFTGNKGNTILVQGGNPLTIEYNNLEGNTGTYDLYLNIASGVFVFAQHNWWGTTDNLTIAERIYDWNDDDTKATASYTLKLTAPDQTAPGYVRSVTVLPDTTLGIQTSTFETQFSKPMDTNYSPANSFHNNNLGTWSQYTTSNSGLPGNNYVYAIAIDDDGKKWFGTWDGGVASFDGTSWTVYNTYNSGLPNNNVYAIAIEDNGTKWFSTYYGGVASFDGTSWTVYNTSNSGLPNNIVYTIKIDDNGTKWFGTNGGVASFDGTTWTVYTSSNSGLKYNAVYAIEIEDNGTKWFGTHTGLSIFDGSSWTSIFSLMVTDIATDSSGNKWMFYNTNLYKCSATSDCTIAGNWQIPLIWPNNMTVGSSTLNKIYIENDKKIWILTNGPGSSFLASFDGNYFIYQTSNSGLPSNMVYSFAIDKDGSKWVGTSGGIGLLHGAEQFPIVENQQWPSPSLYRASYDITSAITKGTYRVVLSDAIDPDGMRVAPFSNTTFNVDYAGFISDTTPPVQPAVTASGDGTLTSISASWSSTDAESPITQYRYGIGTTPGARDVVAWTYVSSTTTSITRSGLNLTQGQPYYVTVGARNEGGLWSEDGVSNGVIAGVAPPEVFGKSAPVNGATNQSISPTLSWGTSTGAVSYEYCYDTSNDDACSVWVSNGTNTTIGLSGLSTNTTYYWQVRAINPSGTTYANGATWWSFTTIPDAPAAFNKSAPSNGAVNQPLNPTLSWGTSTGAVSYEYCFDSVNNSTCEGTWASTGTNSSVGLSGLSINTTYYWQVRAINPGGTTYANGTTWWSFTTVPDAPAAFNKSAPLNDAVNQPTSPTLSWATSSGATSYEYCYDTTNDSDCSSWTSTGTNTTIGLSGLSTNTTYYWQVRAINAGGTTYANGTPTIFWSFTTVPDAPAAFNKSAPVNGASNQSTSPTLSWGTSTGAASYEYCFDAVNNSTCEGTWTSTGTNSSIGLSGLSTNTTYYWQVRAINPGGTTYANGATWWSFSTLPPAPGEFDRLTPLNGAINQSTSPTLTWEISAGATSYEYCYDTTDDNACSAWIDNGISTSKALSGLTTGITYYWHVRAINAGDTVYANGTATAFWSFTTLPNPPAAFGKISPTNGVINQSISPILTWSASTGAVSYEYCYDTTDDDACSLWINNGAATSKALSGLTNGTTYYWQVRAINPGGTTYANTNTWWSFTTVPDTPPTFSLFLPLVLR